ncbi:MAG: ABC-F family ATP-binding cassette domain-containing protein, partial [Bacteroidales bacterium]|nr:ABC-F family ATP-binding cassette domain-containing protein [Bacteroidales bacterium]
YLTKSRRTLFMVTHDRYFLDRVCNTILELDGGKLYTYKGNYSYYLEKREERLALASAMNDKYRNLYRRELEWMRSTPCARTGKARYRENAFYELKEKAAPIRQSSQLAINIGASRLGSKIVNCRGASFSYGSTPMLRDFSYNFIPGEKVGIVGGNGVGKTTFLKILTGELRCSEGEIEWGETVRFGYYRQEGIGLRDDLTVLEAVREIAETAKAADGQIIPVTTFLQQFLFPHEMFNTRIDRLSGGERRRLYLLTVLMRRPNVLVLDEPTNDLDIVTLNVLEEYLKQYEGSVIIVSHDRFFLDKLADHLFVFTGGGAVKDFVGSYSEYREYVKDLKKKELQQQREMDAASQRSSQRGDEGAAKGAAVRKLTYKERKEMEQLEADLAELARRRAAIEEALSSGTLPIDQLTAKSVEIKDIITEIDLKELRWLELSEIGE